MDTNTAMAFLPLVLIVAIIILVIWSAVWKGIALWKCGRNNQLGWFIVLFLINTAGILEIVYLLWFQRKQPAEPPK
ncbi:MAG: DUF5652 family protein [Planctomycetota bacterium]